MDPTEMNAPWRRVAGAVAVSAGFGAPADGQVAAAFGDMAAGPGADEEGVAAHAHTSYCTRSSRSYRAHCTKNASGVASLSLSAACVWA